MSISRIVCIFLLVFVFHAMGAAQRKDKVEVSSQVTAENADNKCKDFRVSRALNVPKPEYPVEARTLHLGGTILLTVAINEKGAVSEVETISGHKLLHTAATNAARKTKFTPTTCDGSPSPAKAILVYNFIPFIAAEKFYTPTKIEEFSDLKNDSPYYEAVLNLTENYKLAFGYSDKKFYADAPLTRGDFAHYLRLTLDLLSERARAANKMPREINLFNSYNPQNVVSATGVKDIKPNMPFYESFRTLLLKYDISMLNEKGEFQGRVHLTNNEVLDWWSRIFGEEAIPVNFARVEGGDRIISRGEFALFLQESLQVLTYKVLP